MRGRVLSVLMVLLGSFYPLGAVVQGAIADEIGLRPTTAGAAVTHARHPRCVAPVCSDPSFASAVEAPVAPLDGLRVGLRRGALTRGTVPHS